MDALHVLLSDPLYQRTVAQLYAGSLALPAFSLSGPAVPSCLGTALLRATAGETQIWPGDLRVVAVAVLFLVVLVFP